MIKNDNNKRIHTNKTNKSKATKSHTTSIKEPIKYFWRRGFSDITNTVLRAFPRISCDENSTSSAGERSGCANAVLSENLAISLYENSISGAEGSQTVQIQCFGRLRAFRATKIVLPAPASAQAMQMQCFLRISRFRCMKIVFLAPRVLRHYKYGASVSAHFVRRK